MQYDIRRTAIAGTIECGDLDRPTNISFTEWWSGEGLDITFSRKTSEFSMSLSLDEAQALVTVLIAAGFVDINEAQIKAEIINRAADQRQQSLDDLRSIVDEACAQESFVGSRWSAI